MKKSLTIIAVLALFGAIGCNKEAATVDSLDSSSTPDEQTGGTFETTTVSFTVSYGDTKAYNADGTKCSFEVGDIIYIGTDHARITADDYTNGAKVVLADTNLVDSGAGAKFKVALPSEATKYYAVMTGSTKDLFWACETDGTCTTNAVTGFNSNIVPHLAMAICDAGTTSSFTFHPAASILKWKDSTGYIKAVSITDASGNNAILGGAYKVKWDGSGFTSTPASGGTTTMNSQNYKSAGTMQFVMIQPGLDLTSGLTVKMYNSTAISDANLVESFTTKGFTSTPGTMYNLGDLYKRSNYGKWQAGEDFIIGGKTYNKATNGTGKLLNTSDNVATVIDAANVYFIPTHISGVALYRARNSVIIGNNTSVKSSIAVTEASGAYNGSATDIAFYNVDFTANQALGTKTFNVGGALSARFEDCKVTVKGPVYTSSNALGDIVFNDCDIFCDFASSENSAQSQLFTVSAAQTCGTFKMNNCVVWCSQASSKGITFLIASSSTFSDIAVTNTTMVNCWDNDGKDYLFGASNTSDLTISGNLIYMPGKRIVFLNLSGATENPGTITGNMTYAGSGKFMEYNGTSVWFTGGGNSTYSENPFSTYDPATGTFVKKGTYSDYGATR